MASNAVITIGSGVESTRVSGSVSIVSVASSSARFHVEASWWWMSSLSKMGCLGINRNRSPSFVSGLFKLYLETVHDGHDNNSRGDPSRSWVTKHPILSGRPNLVGYTICFLHIGTRNLTLWLHRKRTNALSQTPDLGVNFYASSTAKITTGNSGWF